jgi:hypothetical protein
MERCLGEALSAGGDYADLYFESITSTSLGIDESLVKSASQSISVGCGIRVLSGERTGYAYTDDLSSTASCAPPAPQPSSPAARPSSPSRASATPPASPPLPHRRGHRRRRNRRQACPHPARRQGRPRLRSPHHPGPRRLQRRAAPHPHRRIRRHLRLRHPAPRPPQHLRHRPGRHGRQRRGQHHARHLRRRRPRHSRLL